MKKIGEYLSALLRLDVGDKILAAATVIGLGVMGSFVYQLIGIMVDDNADSGADITNLVPLYVIASAVLFAGGLAILAKARRPESHGLAATIGALLLAPGLLAIGAVLVSVVAGVAFG